MLSINTARPAAVPKFAESDAPIKATSPTASPTDFSRLRIHTGPPKKAKTSGGKPLSPSSITDIPRARPSVPSTPRVPETPRVHETPCVPMTPRIPETPRVRERTPVPSTPLAPHKKLGKIVCKKCDRLLDRARRCCGTYSVALCIRVEHIPEKYRPRVGCSGYIRAHFPSFAKASRYRMFLSNQMRKKRKLRFMVEFEDSEEDTRKRQRNDSVQKIPADIATNKILSGYHASNLMGGFSQTYNFSPPVPWQFNQQARFGFGLAPPIASMPREKLFIPPPD